MVRFAAVALVIFVTALVLGVLVLAPMPDSSSAEPAGSADGLTASGDTGTSVHATDQVDAPDEPLRRKAADAGAVTKTSSEALPIDVTILNVPSDSLTAEQKTAVEVADRIVDKAVRMAAASGEPLPDEDRKRMREILYTAEVMRQRYYYSLGTVTPDGNVKIQVRTPQIREARKIANDYVEEHALSLLTGSQLNAVIAAQYGELNEDLSIRIAGGATISMSGVTEADLAEGQFASPTVVMRPAPDLPLPNGPE